MKKLMKEMELKLSQEKVTATETSSLESSHESEQSQDPYWG